MMMKNLKEANQNIANINIHSNQFNQTNKLFHHSNKSKIN